MHRSPPGSTGFANIIDHSECGAIVEAQLGQTVTGCHGHHRVATTWVCVKVWTQQDLDRANHIALVLGPPVPGLRCSPESCRAPERSGVLGRDSSDRGTATGHSAHTPNGPLHLTRCFSESAYGRILDEGGLFVRPSPLLMVCLHVPLEGT